jgi:hypothetical protein
MGASHFLDWHDKLRGMNTTCRETASETRGEETDARQLCVTAAGLAATMTESVERFVCSADQNLGHLEAQLATATQELLRQAAEAGAQRKADVVPPRCPKCQRELTRLSHGQPRSFTSRFGELTVRRTRGYCQRCRKWRAPADAALGLVETNGYSPAVQEMTALLATKMPVGEASLVLERLTALKVPRATLDREARRQGQRAVELRRALDAQPAAPPSRQLELTLEPYQMVLQIDAWNIRERDHWGETAAQRKKGAEPERWHWVYTGTCFRLDQRARTAGGRPLIVERGFAATRDGIAALREQLHAEARRRGLGQATGALVIADGAVWIWRLADDRFPGARQRLDFYHAVQHLAAVGRVLCGDDRAKLQAWLHPLVRQLKNDSAVKVVRQLEDILATLPAGAAAANVRTEVAYFRSHEKRMDYRAARRRGEPLGSGAVEATCRQYQCRFKRPGQFWSRTGDEALLALETLWRNGRWHLLFPHASPFDPSRN